jgi:PKD domain
VDRAGNRSQSATDSFTVDTQPPVAELIAAPNPALIGAIVTLDAGGSSDLAGGPITAYQWDLDGNGTYETNTGTNPRTTVTFNHPGTFTIGLRVTNSVGHTATATISLAIEPLITYGDAGVIIDGNRRYTNRLAVTLTITAPPFADQIRVSNGGGPDGMPFAIPAPTFALPWTLDSSSGRETRIVYVRFYAGDFFLESQTDDIVLDQTPPVLKSAVLTPAPNKPMLHKGIPYMLRVRARDNRSGVAQIETRRGRTVSRFHHYKQRLLVYLARHRKMTIRVKDGAGNTSGWKTARLASSRTHPLSR